MYVLVYRTAFRQYIFFNSKTMSDSKFHSIYLGGNFIFFSNHMEWKNLLHLKCLQKTKIEFTTISLWLYFRFPTSDSTRKTFLHFFSVNSNSSAEKERLCSISSLDLLGIPQLNFGNSMQDKCNSWIARWDKEFTIILNIK